MDAAPVLELRGITKQFPGVLANDHIDFDLRRGEVHALLGENGAGKSTLMSILYGLYTADSGEVLMGGKPVEISSPKHAIELGIGMVHQHFMLIPVMTVTENIVLAQEPKHAGVLLDYDVAAKRVREFSESFGLAVDPNARILDITVGQQQRVEILKALYRGAEILILDEPTAVLTPQEAQELFEIINELKAQGKSIVFISHKLSDERGLEAVRNVTFAVRAGEILGIAGVDGNGQTELIDALSGLRHPVSGSIRIGGHELSRATARDALDAGVGHIPEDRQRRGLVLDFNLAENLVLHDYGREPFSKFGWINPRGWFRWARGLLQEFDVRGGGPTTRGSSLSGGNQQKVVIAREVSRNPSVLIAAQPTRGLDVGAIEFVHRRLVEQRDAGKAVLLVSLELEEIVSLSDRILVLYEGRIVAEFPPDVSEEEIGIAMVGGHRSEAA